MGLILTPPSKTIIALYNEAWATNIQSADNPSAELWADPMVTVHFRERTVYSDGTSSATNDPTKTTPNFVQQVSFRMSAAVMRNGTLAYKDRTGADRTLSQGELPLGVKAFLDLIGTEARQARADEIAAEAARLAEEAARLLAEQEALNSPPPEE